MNLRLLDSRRTLHRKITAVILLAISSVGSGCQTLGFRNSKEASDLAYDDWAISSPHINPPKVKLPAPSAYAKRRMLEQDAAPETNAAAPAETAAANPAAPEPEAPVATASAESAPAESAPVASESGVVQASAEVPAGDTSAVQPATAEEPVPGESKPSGPVKVSLKDAEEDDADSSLDGDQSASNKSDNLDPNDSTSQADGLHVIDAGVDEIDFEGALADLPAPYRDLLRRQLQATQNNQSDNSTAASGETDKIRSEAKAPGETTSAKVAIKASLSDASIDADVTTLTSEALDASLANAAPANNVVAASAALPLDKVSTAIPDSTTEATGSGDISLSQWNQALAQSIELLQKQIAQTPASDANLRLHHEIALRMLFVAARRLDEACTPVEGMSTEENSYLRHQMQALFEASNPDAMPVRSRHLSLVMNSQREATNQLAAASNLEVRSASFCTEVERFGVVTKFPKYQFVEDQEVLLYCEIENVAAKALKEGFETQLQGSYEILDAQGNRVSEQILPMEPDFCQNHRRDYFIVYQIYMPQQIQPGNYKLRLTIEDMNARKFGQSTLDFQIKK